MKTDYGSVQLYTLARDRIFEAGYGPEYEWQLAVAGQAFEEHDFLREYAWVVLNCGFRESTVRKIFSFISLAFFDFTSALDIVTHGDDCVEIAAGKFGNRKKLWAIVSAARLMTEVESIEVLRDEMHSNPEALNLPFLGSVTRNHLLKNLGVGIAKNDRHLARLSAVYGFSNAQELCEHISWHTGEPIAAIDVVLWRFATLIGGTEAIA